MWKGLVPVVSSLGFDLDPETPFHHRVLPCLWTSGLTDFAKTNKHDNQTVASKQRKISQTESYIWILQLHGSQQTANLTKCSANCFSPYLHVTTNVEPPMGLKAPNDLAGMSTDELHFSICATGGAMIDDMWWHVNVSSHGPKNLKLRRAMEKQKTPRLSRGLNNGVVRHRGSNAFRLYHAPYFGKGSSRIRFSGVVSVSVIIAWVTLFCTTLYRTFVMKGLRASLRCSKFIPESLTTIGSVAIVPSARWTGSPVITPEMYFSSLMLQSSFQVFFCRYFTTLFVVALRSVFCVELLWHVILFCSHSTCSRALACSIISFKDGFFFTARSIGPSPRHRLASIHVPQQQNHHYSQSLGLHYSFQPGHSVTTRHPLQTRHSFCSSYLLFIFLLISSTSYLTLLQSASLS